MSRRAATNFYPRPPRGGRLLRACNEMDAFEFLSTPSARRATALQPSLAGASFYFYPRPPRGGRQHKLTERDLEERFLSTPSARRATFQGWCYTELAYISIHALREEGDLCSRIRNQKDIHFYPRPPRGGRHVVVPLVFDLDGFLSTPSARRATSDFLQPHPVCGISIHALREEGDSGKRTICPPGRNFYPRPPRGGRLAVCLPLLLFWLFLSTPSARRATVDRHASRCFVHISIHALREEGDRRCCSWRHCGQYFYPRPPRGGRRRRTW